MDAAAVPRARVESGSRVSIDDQDGRAAARGDGKRRRQPADTRADDQHIDGFH
jgi:hypothetical protein